MNVFGKVDQLRGRVKREGLEVDSPYGRTRELTGVTLSFTSEEARGLTQMPLREDHPEFVPFARDAPRLAYILGKTPSSRRAVSYIGRQGLNREEEVCIPVGQFALRDGALLGFFYVRSVDMRRLPEDAVALARSAGVVADRTGVVLGAVTLFIASAHVYLDGGGKLT
jgi:hypothetical protein